MRERGGSEAVADGAGDGISRGDLCAGWAVDATMMQTIAETGAHPVTLGPEAPSVTVPDDVWAWHELAPMALRGMRRLRRLDLSAPAEPGGSYALDLAADTYKLWITDVPGYPDQAYGPDGTFANATVIDLTTTDQTVDIDLPPPPATNTVSGSSSDTPTS